MTTVAGIVVVLAGLWLVGLGVGAFAAPGPTAGLLGRFASTARAHYTEHLLRLTAGAAFVLYAGETRFPRPFEIFGWVLVATSALLLLLPWRWHHRFGRWAIPLAVRHLRLLGLGSLALGGLVLYAVAAG